MSIEAQLNAINEVMLNASLFDTSERLFKYISFGISFVLNYFDLSQT